MIKSAYKTINKSGDYMDHCPERFQVGEMTAWLVFCLTNVVREIRIKHNFRVTGLQIKPEKTKSQRGQPQFVKPNQLSSPASLMLRCNTATTAEAKQELSKGHPELTGKCLQRETSSRSCKTVFPPISSLTKNTHICNLVGKHPSRATLYPGNCCLSLPQRSSCNSLSPILLHVGM